MQRQSPQDISQILGLSWQALFQGALLVIIIGTLAVALVLAILPGYLVPHLAYGGGGPKALLIQGIAPAIALFSVAMVGLRHPAWARCLSHLALPLALVSFGCFAAFLGHWIVDDAGITFAYARNLADGYGLVAFPGHAPEEGYSSTLWVLILAGVHLVGLPIPLTAKVLGGLFGIAALALAFELVRQDRGAREAPILGLLLAFSMICTAPFVIWSVSGQEHSLEALIIVLMLWFIDRLRDWRRWVTGLLVLLVLLRPEAPVFVAVIFAGGLVERRFATGSWQVMWNLPLILVPFLTFCGLELFRWIYFRDLLPNPFYAKAAGDSSLSVLNLFGGGWVYVISGLRDTGLLAIVPVIIIASGGLHQRLSLYGGGVLSAQLFFVLWAHGDWMAQYRFLMPVIPVFAVLGARAFARLDRLEVPLSHRVMLAGALSFLLLFNSAGQINAFQRNPTTPFSVVREVGQEFSGLATRLGVRHPILAHHDAGGILYDRSIDLVDLGGLADRAVAKHMRDRTWLERYLLDKIRPTFFFGADNFATASGYTKAPKFKRDYVPLEFPGLSFMRAYLCAVRRDVVHAAPGIEIVRVDNKIVRVVVHPPP